MLKVILEVKGANGKNTKETLGEIDSLIKFRTIPLVDSILRDRNHVFNMEKKSFTIEYPEGTAFKVYVQH